MPMIGPDSSRQNPRPRRVDPRLAIAVAVTCAVLVLGWSTSWASSVHIVLAVMQLITYVNQSVRPPRRRCAQCGAEV
jgi:hypothetical protein